MIVKLEDYKKRSTPNMYAYWVRTLKRFLSLSDRDRNTISILLKQEIAKSPELKRKLERRHADGK